MIRPKSCKYYLDRPNLSVSEQPVGCWFHRSSFILFFHFPAPEVVNFDEINYFTDMWSVGVICYVLLSGLSPFQGETDIDTMTNVTLGKYNFDDDAFRQVSNTAKDFIRRLLQKEPRYVPNT